MARNSPATIFLEVAMSGDLLLSLAALSDPARLTSAVFFRRSEHRGRASRKTGGPFSFGSFRRWLESRDSSCRHRRQWHV